MGLNNHIARFPYRLPISKYLVTDSDLATSILSVAKASTVIPVVAYDGFNRADDAASMGSADTGQVWVSSMGTWGISGNKAYNASGTLEGKCGMDSGIVDGRFAADMYSDTYATAGPHVPTLTFRGVDALNYLSVVIYNGVLYLSKYEAGVGATLGSVAQVMAEGATYNAEAVCIGVNIFISINGVQKINYTLIGGDAITFTAANCTRIGLRTGGTANLNLVRFDNVKAWGV